VRSRYRPVVPPADTTQEAFEIERRAVLAMTVEQRLTRMADVVALERAMIAAGVRRRHPALEPIEVERAVRRVLWGDQLFDEVSRVTPGA
jgi:hypothetical protein